MAEARNECAICLQPLLIICTTLPCGHEFHGHCLRQALLARNFRCPLCRADLLPELTNAFLHSMARLEVIVPPPPPPLPPLIVAPPENNQQRWAREKFEAMRGCDLCAHKTGDMCCNHRNGQCQFMWITVAFLLYFAPFAIGAAFAFARFGVAAQICAALFVPLAALCPLAASLVPIWGAYRYCYITPLTPAAVARMVAIELA
jgi:hypothetical protein